MREKDDLYPFISLQWVDYSDTPMRIIECKDRIQWIVQRRTGGEWRSEGFCRTRAGLESRVSRMAPEIRAAFPPRFIEQ